MIKLDWAAPIVPRESCLGLTLGMTLSMVEQALVNCRVGQNDSEGWLIQFDNSPVLRVNKVENGFKLLDSDLQEKFKNPLHSQLCGLSFDSHGYLDAITLREKSEALNYLGKFQGVGLGDRISKLNEIDLWHHDWGNDVVYPTNPDYIGLEVGADESIEDEPNQTIWFMIVFKPKS